jgi:hypothetical protein
MSIRTAELAADFELDAEAMHFGGLNQFGSQLQETRHVEDVPPADKCIGQIVLDWEFIHDLDLHLLKVVPAQQACYPQNGLAQEPQPEPESLEAGSIDFDLGDLVNPTTNELKLKSGQKLEQIVWYGNKVFNPRGAAMPQAVLQLDRNAAVHSIKPVENLYLTKELDAGVYVVGVHNYSQHQLNDNVIGASANHTYRSFEEFKKKYPGYQKMEKALNEQLLHTDDPDGTPEKLAIMTRVDQEMSQGSQMIQRSCCSCNGKYGVHYGAMIYSYPSNASKHPQTCTVEELQNDFPAEMFATSDCIFNPEANHGGYNGANILAEVRTEEGKLALCHSQAAHVALIKVVRDDASDGAKVVEVKMLRGMPKDGITTCDAEGGSVRGGVMSAMNQFRAQMGNRRNVLPQQQQFSRQSRISEEAAPMRLEQQSSPWQPQMEMEPTFMEQMSPAHQMQPVA